MRCDVFQLVAKLLGVLVKSGPTQLLNQTFKSLRRQRFTCSLVSQEPCTLQHSILQGVNIFTHFLPSTPMNRTIALGASRKQ